MSHGLEVWSTTLAGLGLTWLVQSSVLLVVGLMAGRILRRSSPAVQSGVYRTTLAAVFVCPVVSAALAGAGLSGFSIRLPSPANSVSSETTSPVPHAKVEATRALDRDEPVSERVSRVENPVLPESTPLVNDAIAAAAAPRTVVLSSPITLRGVAALGPAVWRSGSRSWGCGCG